MVDVEVNASNALWNLMLATIMFLAVFVLVTGMVPSEFYVGETVDKYDEYRAGGKFSAKDVNIFNASTRFNMTYCSTHEVNLGGHDLRFYYVHPQMVAWNPNTFDVKHFVLWNGIETGGHFLTPVGDKGNSYNGGFDFWQILAEYDNATRSSKVSMKCEHITVTLTICSNQTNPDGTLYYLGMALFNHLPIHVEVEYEIDFSKMGANIWTILGQVLTFQVIRTNSQPIIDLMLNVLVSVPLYVSIGYMFYRLIAGLIPFMSGGGGQ